jgi:hypothetical protein
MVAAAVVQVGLRRFRHRVVREEVVVLAAAAAAAVAITG